MTAAELKARFPRASEDTIRKSASDPVPVVNQHGVVAFVEDTPEKQIQQEIEDWLKSLRPHCYFVRSRMDRATTTAIGTPDFIGWMNGRCFALEVKKKGRKPTIEQLAALKMAESAGATVAVVHSKEEAHKVLINCTAKSYETEA